MAAGVAALKRGVHERGGRVRRKTGTLGYGDLENPDRAIRDLLRQADLPRQATPPRRAGAENSRAKVVEQVLAVRGHESHERELARVVRQLEVVANMLRGAGPCLGRQADGSTSSNDVRSGSVGGISPGDIPTQPLAGTSISKWVGSLRPSCLSLAGRVRRSRLAM